MPLFQLLRIMTILLNDEIALECLRRNDVDGFIHDDTSGTRRNLWIRFPPVINSTAIMKCNEEDIIL